MDLTFAQPTSKVIFLDVDGVIHPVSSLSKSGAAMRSRHEEKEPADFEDIIADLEGRYPDLREELGHAFCNWYFKAQLGIAYNDFSEISCQQVASLCDAHQASIVVSSDWRETGSKSLLLYMTCAGLEERVSGVTYLCGRMYLNGRRWDYDLQRSFTGRTKALGLVMDKLEALNKSRGSVEYRSTEIACYLLLHPEIESFLILDDLPLDEDFPNNALRIHDDITDDLYARAQEILSTPYDRASLPKLTDAEQALLEDVDRRNLELFCRSDKIVLEPSWN